MLLEPWSLANRAAFRKKNYLNKSQTLVLITRLQKALYRDFNMACILKVSCNPKVMRGADNYTISVRFSDLNHTAHRNIETSSF